jgi:hypothetical protein
MQIPLQQAQPGSIEEVKLVRLPRALPMARQLRRQGLL